MAAIDQAHSEKLADAISALTVDPKADGRRRRAIPANQGVASIFDGDFIMFVFDKNTIYATKYYVDNGERVVYIRSVVQSPLML
jgi:hypothetical protein